MVAFINHQNIPRLRFSNSLKVVAMHGPMNACDDLRIREPSIAIDRAPLTEAEPQAIKFPSHIAHEPRRCEIKNPQAGTLFEQFLNQKTDLDCFSKPYFVCDEYPPEMIRIKHMPH